jgi:hypothetical protein
MAPPSTIKRRNKVRIVRFTFIFTFIVTADHFQRIQERFLRALTMDRINEEQRKIDKLFTYVRVAHGTAGLVIWGHVRLITIFRDTVTSTFADGLSRQRPSWRNATSLRHSILSALCSSQGQNLLLFQPFSS